jgi:hypothetical protein
VRLARLNLEMQSMIRPLKRSWLTCFVIAAAFIGGCTPSIPNFVAATLPAALQFVSDNAAEFTFADTSPPAGAADVTDKTALNGCWGRVADGGDVELPYVGTQPVQVLETLHFDAAAGSLASDGLLRQTNGDLEVLVIATGTFELLADSTVRMSLTVTETNDPSTGAPVATGSTKVSESTPQVQIVGDQLVLTYQPSATDAGATAHSVVYQRFDCP